MEQSCFFCLEKFQEETGSVFPFRSFLHYLGLEKESINNEGRRETCFICKMCSMSIGNFEELFQLWQSVEMRLSLCMQEIETKIQLTTTEAEEGLAVKNRLDPDPFHCNLKKKIKQKCACKALAFQPDVCLVRLEMRMELPQIKTETEEVDPLSPDPETFFSPPPSPFYDLDREQKEQDQKHNYLGLDSEDLQHTSGLFKEAQLQPISTSHSNQETKTEASQNDNKIKKLGAEFKYFVRQGLDQVHYDCETCGKTFGSQAGIISHINSIHRKLTYSCPKCSKTFTTTKYLHRHKLICKGSKAANVQKKDTTLCKLCGRYVKTRYMNYHRKDVHLKTSKRFPCHLCGKDFCRPARLKQHQRVAHLGLFFQCGEPECGKKYAVKYDLDIHKMKAHK